MSSHSRITNVTARFSRAVGLPFSDILTSEEIESVIAKTGHTFRRRTFDPTTTVWAFLSQTFDADQSCRAIVSRIAAHRAAHGEPQISSRTGGYVRSRQRLSEGVFRELAQNVARRQEKQCPQHWRWHNRRVVFVDGSSLFMPDTEQNQLAYPQHTSLESGLGFPIARIIALFDRNTGCVLDARISRFAGKGTGESALFRQMWPELRKHDVVVGDRLYSTYANYALLKSKGVDLVCAVRSGSDKRYKRKLRVGKNERFVTKQRPYQRPDWMTLEEFNALPRELRLREVTVTVTGRDGKPTTIEIVTTLLDRKRYPAKAVAALYAERWNAELDFRSLKTTMKMEALRCKSPEMCRKEFYCNILAYNLIRVIAVKAAEKHDMTPRQISFQGTRQIVRSFAPYLANTKPDERKRMTDYMLDMIASHPVGNRPGRWEPRKVKKRPKQYDLLTKPRWEERRTMLQH